MLYLLDSDAAKCLCQYLLIDDLAAALGVSVGQFAVLPQLKYQLHLGSPTKSLSKLGSQAAVVAALQLIESASEVTIQPQSANAALLADRPDIDSGELILFAALGDSDKNHLLTGDKRALVALSKINPSEGLTLVWSRILCLEEAIAILVAHFGHLHVSAKVRARQDVNVALSIVFGRSVASTEESTEQGLASYLTSLTTDTSGLYTPLHLMKAEGKTVEK